MIPERIDWKVVTEKDGRERTRTGSAEIRKFTVIECDLEGERIKSATATIPFRFERDDRIFLNGYQTWTHSPQFSVDSRIRGTRRIPRFINNYFSLDAYGDYTFVDYPYKKGKLHGFSLMTLHRSGRTLLLASLDEKPGWTIIRTDSKGCTITLERDAGGMSGGIYQLFSLFIAEGEEEKELYRSWFSHMGFTISQKPLAGYSSWYNRYQEIDEEAILYDLEGCKKIFREGDLFQIDDGWEEKVGDWVPDKSKFPSPFPSLMEKIHAGGFKAGLWLAPFVAEEKSRIWKEHQDWFLKKDGKPFRCGCNWSGFYALDIDHPEVREYLEKTFSILRNEWKVDLVKLDFLYAAAPFAKDGETRAGRMERAMELLRSLLPDVAILACGVPLYSAFGNAEYSRVSMDVTLDWNDRPHMRIIHRERPSTRNAIITSWARRHFSEGGFITDPDVFFLRNENIRLSGNEKRMLSEAAALNKGLFLTSDNPSTYTDEMRDEYRRVRDIWENAEDIHTDIENGVHVIRYVLHGEKRKLELFF